MSMRGSWLTGPAPGSRLSAAKGPSSNMSADLRARIFGLFLAALCCLVLNAVSPSTRICQQSETGFGGSALEGGSYAGQFGTIHSKECATSEGRKEPGY
jgi:hypothetical protein